MLLLAGPARAAQRLRLLIEQSLAAASSEPETTRRHLADSERAVLAALSELRGQTVQSAGETATLLAREQGQLRAALSDERDKAAQQAEARPRDARIPPARHARRQ